MKQQNNPLWLLLFWGLAAILTPLLAVFLGVADIPLIDVWSAITGNGSANTHSIIWDIRLPRIITGALAGIHLAVAGLILQNITRNPLADPSIMGISQGATFAVSLFLLLAMSQEYHGSAALPALPLEYLPTIGLGGGLLAGLIIYYLGSHAELSPLRLTLCGIAVGAVLHALAIGMIAGWGSNRMEIMLEWLTGSLYARSWEHVRYLLPYTIIGLCALIFIRRPLNLLQFDPLSAASFGLPYQKHFTIVLAFACLMAASAVGTVGPISFIGLVVPHLARFLSRKSGQFILPLTIFLGMITMTLSDLAGRLIGQADDIPVGVMSAFFGAPIFIVLLRKIP
ncbi:FecCD family ABC transporter permease [Paenochrobactrum pullorum]|uniref:FecCD family ABC transporter permease n=1 Tax=Paenochrobactrum pullorum TaxID=1324351 RepID=UPI0035BC4385